jgi:tetratricopeptide (TPR) repeat protein
MATPETRPRLLRYIGLSGWKVSTDVSMVSYYLLVFFVGGLALVYIQERGGKPFTALLWALACFTVGATIGFLFGIPRVLQQDATAAPPSSAGAGPGATSALTYNLKVNTNLEQISDWLTKIFVGLGLVELQRVPDHLNRAAAFIAYGLTNGSKFFAGSLIVYFSLLGFLGFYLITRLYIAGALSRADQEASQKLKDIMQVENIDVRLDADGPTLSQTERKAAINLVSEPIKSATAQDELAIRAKALLSLNKYAEAADVYRQLLNLTPNDSKVRFEYAVCLFYLGNLQEAYQQMLHAYSLLTTTYDPKLKRDIYRSLTFQALYQPPPKGFEDAIRFGEEYVRDSQNIPEPAIWTNLAAAYGQKAAWLATQSTVDPQAFAEARRHALDAASRAIQFGEEWRNRIRELLVKDAPNKDPKDNDLEIFEHDNAFRRLVGLADEESIS